MDSYRAPAGFSRSSEKELRGCESDDAAPALSLRVRDHFARKIYAAEKVRFEGALPLLEGRGKKPFGRRASALVT